MHRTVHLSGRVDLPKGHCQISVQRNGGTPQINFEGIHEPGRFPTDAPISVKVHQSKNVRILSCGTVGAPTSPNSEELRDFPFQTFNCQVRIISPDKSDKGKLLASTKSFAMKLDAEPDSVKGILPVSYDDISPRLWRLDIGEDEVGLVINSEVPMCKRLVKDDSLFHAAVFPEIVAKLLHSILNQENREFEDADWRKVWVDWAQLFTDDELPEYDSHADDYDDWVDRVVDGFLQEKSVLRELIAVREEDR